MLDCYALMATKHLVVDGSNIATEGRTMPSLAQLDEAVRAFIAERPMDNYTVIVDATFEHRIDASERKLYDDALAANELIVTPAGTVGRGDRFILEVADRAGAIVLSNDSFQEFHGDYGWLFDSGRLIGGRPVPGVGWVFVERSPVRGPKSRQATRDAKRKRGPATKAAAAPRAAPTAPSKSSGRPRGAKKAVGDAAPAKRAKAAGPGKAAGKPAGKPPAAKAPPREGDGRRRTGRPQQPLNDQLPFIEFIAEHLPGSTVEGEVVEFSSHGAYVQIGDVRCYVPLKNMGDPPPRSARDVLERGQVRTFVVHSIEAARRGIDLALPGFERIAASPTEPVATPPRPRRSRAAAADTTLPVAASNDAAPAVDRAPAAAGANQPESEATLAATKKAAGRKTAAKKSTARKSTAKKATARKSTARKATAKRAPAKKATARKRTAKKATAKKSTAKKATARKSTAKKSAAKKSTARKSTAKKAAKKSTAKKSTAKKAGARKSSAKKAGARKRPAKKSTAKKSTARKSTARKRPAKKSTARKSTARKAGARKSTARKR